MLALGHIKKMLLSILIFKVGVGREFFFFSFFPLSFVDMEKYDIKTAFSSK
jgi:hypothetical protein